MNIWYNSYMLIGEQIKKARVNKKMTQEKLARLLFVDRSLISRWESGKNIPTPEHIQLLSDLLDTQFVIEEENEDHSILKRIKNYKLIFIGALCFLFALGIFLFNQYRNRDINVFLNEYLKASSDTQVFVTSNHKKTIHRYYEYDKTAIYQKYVDSFLDEKCSEEAIDEGLDTYHQFRVDFNKQIVEKIKEAKPVKTSPSILDSKGLIVTLEIDRNSQKERNDAISIYQDGIVVLKRKNQEYYYQIYKNQVTHIINIKDEIINGFYEDDQCPCWIVLDS